MKKTNLKPTKNPLHKLIGLLGSKQKILFEFNKPKKVSVHTWFMRQPIKIHELDENKKVLKKLILKPFKTYTTEHKVKYLYEEKV
ncbi:hypothetical protein COV11_00915 [Candidatus Woesearchaeota archaeon CG10_big_fil_rev_8_21_14_0_10_30_7]|nr:MAG: hypothetical protein COV11_00915 [Candidatus Woesearchaeota archaeon CG10_big_fil_rev_8_21_14_0_10_30_7]